MSAYPLSGWVRVCANYRTCTTQPVAVEYIDYRELPICEEGLPMDTEIRMRDWPHRWT
jgi:hypothetical protein